jgi:HEAT repeat protein
MKASIIWALGMLDDSRAIAPLKALLLNAQAEKFHFRLSLSLARLGDNSGGEILRNALKSSDAGERIQALQALRAMKLKKKR